MFWLGLLIKFGVPLALKWGWMNGGEADAIRAWYWAKANIKTYSANDQLHPEQSDFPPEVHNDGR